MSDLEIDAEYQVTIDELIAMLEESKEDNLNQYRGVQQAMNELAETIGLVGYKVERAKRRANGEEVP